MQHAGNAPWRSAVTPGWRRALLRALAFAWVLAAGQTARASDVVEVLPLTDRVLMVHFDDGKVTYHTVGQKRTDDTVTTDPLDTTAASSAGSYRLTSADDSAYGAAGKAPTSLGRKSKATEVAWHCDTWDASVGCINNAGPDHAKEHWIYLFLPTALVHGKTYSLSTGSLAKNGSAWSLVFDEDRARSEAVHVNIVGYDTRSQAKFGYVYHWMGDQGGLDLAGYDGKECRLVRQGDGAVVFRGTLHFRKAASNVETGQSQDTPGANFLGADVYDCDFSAFGTPGDYVLAVEGVGRSFPFRLDEDAYRPAFYSAMKGLFMNRSGIAISAQNGDGFSRPADHNPGVTPGFAGKLKYTTTRYFDVSDADASAADKSAWEAGLRGDIATWGWYQDAGDWDAYARHGTVPAELLLLYELYGDRFADGELNIPESGNGLADLLDEARWLVRFYHRTRHAVMAAGYGTGGVAGARVMGDLWGGDTAADGTTFGSWGDVSRTWIVSGEDPWMSYRYAGLAAQLAFILGRLGKVDPEAIDWRQEAEDSWTWALANTRAGDEQTKLGFSLVQFRLHAAAALYRLTGDAKYHDRFKTDCAAAGYPGSGIAGDTTFAAFVYATMPADRTVDATLKTACLTAIAKRASDLLASTLYDRATRWGGDFYMPMIIGQGSTPLVADGALAYAVLRTSDPTKAAAMLARLQTTADYFLGGNPLNMTWVTGLGERSPRGIFRMDSWYSGKTDPTPGFIPYGPTATRFAISATQGPWSNNWVNYNGKTYPASIDVWPGHERWFDQRTAPLSCENTIDQTAVNAAVVFGALVGPSPHTNPGGGDAGSDSNGASDASTDAGGAANDGSGDSNDAAASPDGGPGAPNDAHPNDGDEAVDGKGDGAATGGGASGGCGCRLSSGSKNGPAPGWLVLGMLPAIVLFRPRRPTPCGRPSSIAAP